MTHDFDPDGTRLPIKLDSTSNGEFMPTPLEYAAKGRYKIAVKVIDIFGNDTTKVVEVGV
jgi:hypothetical protein